MLVVLRAPTSSRMPLQCVAIGAAKLLLPAELTVETARSAVSALLTKPSYRERARDLAGEIQALPGPEALVPILLDAEV